MEQVNIYEAKTNLSQLVDQVKETGKSVLIAKAGKPVAKISPLQQRPSFPWGGLADKIKIADDFDAPLSDEIIASFEGKF